MIDYPEKRSAKCAVLQQALTLLVLPTSLVRAVFVMSAGIPTTYIAPPTTHCGFQDIG
jgi:hypothetical protein